MSVVAKLSHQSARQWCEGPTAHINLEGHVPRLGVQARTMCPSRPVSLCPCQAGTHESCPGDPPSQAAHSQTVCMSCCQPGTVLAWALSAPDSEVTAKL